MYCFEFYNCTKAQLEKRKIYGAIEENSYLKVVTSSNDSHATYKKAKGLRFICYDKKYDRNTSYRQTYFRYNLPNAHPIGKKRNTLWRCCYCGKKLKKREIEVDHLIPVYKAKRQRHWQKKLPNGVNDKTNLVAACRHCNRIKSSKTGLWYVRGLLGQHQLYWKIIYPLTLVITTILLGVIIYYL